MLTDATIRTSKGRDRPYKLTDGGGLYLQVTPGGSKLWRMRYEFGGKEKLLSFGRYPDLGLADARDRRQEAKQLLRKGFDPTLARAKQRLEGSTSQTNTFEIVARDWHARNKPSWTERHAADVLVSLERDVFPSVGALPITDFTPPMILNLVRPIEARPAIETARRVRQRMSAIFVYAIASGLAQMDPAAIVQGAMAPLIKGRQPAVLDLTEAREILNRADAEPAHPITKLALRLLALTAVRPGEIRGAAWVEFENLTGDEPLWRIPAARMKMKREHVVPLSQQAVSVIEAARAFTGRGPLVFPNARHAHKPMSENAMGYLLNRAGYHSRHVPHGWRATFSTIMNERNHDDRYIIDLILAHASKDKTESAYNRAAHLKRRGELLQEWADLLLENANEVALLMSGRRRAQRPLPHRNDAEDAVPSA
jgi:integrase